MLKKGAIHVRPPRADHTGLRLKISINTAHPARKKSTLRRSSKIDSLSCARRTRCPKVKKKTAARKTR